MYIYTLQVFVPSGLPWTPFVGRSAGSSCVTFPYGSALRFNYATRLRYYIPATFTHPTARPAKRHRLCSTTFPTCHMRLRTPAVCFTLRFYTTALPTDVPYGLPLTLLFLILPQLRLNVSHGVYAAHLHAHCYRGSPAFGFRTFIHLAIPAEHGWCLYPDDNCSNPHRARL